MTGVIRSVFPGQPPRHDKRPARAACGRRALVCRGGRGRILVRGSMNVPLTGTTRAEQREIDAAVAHVRARIRALDRSDQARNRTSAALPAYRGWSQNARIAYHPGEPGHRGLDPLPRRPLRRSWLDPKRARRRGRDHRAAEPKRTLLSGSRPRRRSRRGPQALSEARANHASCTPPPS